MSSFGRSSGTSRRSSPASFGPRRSRRSRDRFRAAVRRRHAGDASAGGTTYTVEDGTIVGRVGPGPNTFLRTERTFGDFVLRLDVKLDVPGNSGIQFRSHQRDGDGVVFGYQCEIDPSERSWSGGLYDESRRGWLDSLDGREAARAAFRREGWNACEIRAVGDRIQTWVNGVPCADFRDEADAAGFVALQVHGGRQGQIRWRNIRIREVVDGE